MTDRITHLRAYSPDTFKKRTACGHEWEATPFYREETGDTPNIAAYRPALVDCPKCLELYNAKQEKNSS